MDRFEKIWRVAAAVLTAGGIAALASAARRWAARADQVPAETFDRIDLAGEESFPASDPPGWTLGEDEQLP